MTLNTLIVAGVFLPPKIPNKNTFFIFCVVWLPAAARTAVSDSFRPPTSAQVCALSLPVMANWTSMALPVLGWV